MDRMKQDSITNISLPSLNTTSLSSNPMNSLASGSLITPSDSPEFVHLQESNICPQCKNVLRNAVQLICGHHICQNCLDPLFAEDEVKLCTFDDCGYQISKSQVFPDTYKRREVLKEKVYCIFKKDGCDAIVAWKDLADHIQRCEFAVHPCARAAEGCAAVLSKKMFEKHVNEECDYLPVKCNNCNYQTIKGRFQAHIENDCPMILIDCPYKCGSSRFPRGQLDVHTETCVNKPTVCSFNVIGCDFKGSEEVVANHEKNDLSHHLLLISLYTTKMEQQNKSTMDELKCIKEENVRLETQIKDLEDKCAFFKKAVAENKKMGNDIKVALASQGERAIKLDRKMEDMATKVLVDELTRKVNGVQETNQDLVHRVDVLERNGPIVGEVGGVVPAQVGRQLKQLEKQSTLHDVRLAELDLRFQILETANYDGVLMWKIRDYARRRQEAVTGRTLSLFSQPFYTGRHGYKMCGRVYLNGDGAGRNTHLSFFFVLMKGDYDALLPWPFKQRVSLMIKDQHHCTQDMCDTFTPNTSSNSFKKPETEMNVASGVPKFIPHHTLETPVYLQDDTIYLMIKVDTSNLPNHPNP